MRVLFLAPHPFYQERGTPIATDLLLKALSARGERVDVVTYHEGVSVNYPGVTIHRIRRPPLVRSIRPGFSWKKIVCDGLVFGRAVALCRRRRYDVVHGVEEAAFMGRLLRRLFGVPYVYDMDSSLARQMMDRLPLLRLVGPMLEACERWAVRGAAVVVPVCETLAERARRYGARRVVLLRDVPLFDEAAADGTNGFKSRLGIRGEAVIYVGNLEPYQGIDLLLESFALARRRPEAARATLIIVGGTAPDIARYQRIAERLGIADAVRLLGPQPLARLAEYLRGADILVSPRLQGENTPMKIYSYLRAGRPIVATDLVTHTQVLTPEVALLVEPTPERFAEALVRLIGDPALRTQLGAAAGALAEHRYSEEAFRASVDAIYDGLTASAGSGR